MEIVECIRKNDWCVHRLDDGALNLEREIGLIKSESDKYELAYRLGCDKIYNKTESWKMLYDCEHYNEAWQHISDNKGTIVEVNDNFDEVMKDEKIEMALGNVRISRILFTIKTMTNGKDCGDCEC